MRVNDYEKAVEDMNCELLRVTYHAKSGGQVIAAYGQKKDSLTYIMWDQNGRAFVFDQPEMKPDEMPALEIIYEEAVKHKGEMILFAVGPLTNIAICLEKHPDLPQLLKKFVIMGGGTFGNVSATNKTAYRFIVLYILLFPFPYAASCAR